MPREQVDRFVDCWPAECAHCCRGLAGTGVEDGPAVPYQVQDVRIVREVTQYDRHRVHCAHCGHSTLGPLPAEVVHSQYGPGLTALVAMCSGVFHLARREVERFCHEVCGVSVSVGSVQKLCEEVSAGLAAPVQELTEAIRRQAAVGMDETGWRDKFQHRYLWRVGCALGSVFKIGRRTAAVGQSLLGATFTGCVMTDRYGGYDWIPAKRRQYCWAHLDRDGQGLVELGKAAATYGRAVRQAAQAVFARWRNFQRAGGGPEARLALQAALKPVQTTLRPVLERGCRSRSKKVVNICSDMWLGWDGLWLFSVQQGIEPTNNGSERDVRRAVLWRRRSLGTHSDSGAAFVERMLSVSATCRRQARSPLTYLTAVADALRSGQPMPSLLPPADHEPAGDGACSEMPPQPAPNRSASARSSFPGPEATALPTAPAPSPRSPSAGRSGPAAATGASRPAGLPAAPPLSGAAIPSTRPVTSTARRPRPRPRGHPLAPLGASP